MEKLKSRLIMISIITIAAGVISFIDMFANNHTNGITLTIFFIGSILITVLGTIIAMIEEREQELKSSKYRLQLLKDTFQGLQKDYHENNNATNLADFFNEVLQAIPLSNLVQSKTMDLFKNELQLVLKSRQLKMSSVDNKSGTGLIYNMKEQLKSDGYKVFYMLATQSNYTDVVDNNLDEKFSPDYIHYIKNNKDKKVAIIIDESNMNADIAHYIETEITKYDSPLISCILVNKEDANV